MLINQCNNQIKNNYSNINITAYRAIKILKLLLEKPCSSSEILDCLSQDEITERALSDDTLRLTLNSLNSVGCKIARPTLANNYKYVLLSHPFKFNITKTQVKILLKIRQNFLNSNEWKKVIEINDLFDKIANFAGDEEILNLFCHKKPFAKINKTVLEYFVNDRLSKKEVLLAYNTNSKKREIINIKADYIFCENGKLYIMGWYPKRNCYSYFNAEKISEIYSVKSIPKTQKDEVREKYVIYSVSGDAVKSFTAVEDEEVLMKNKNQTVVKASVKSEFKIIQRLLSFGRNFNVIEPSEIKVKLAEKLRKIREMYE